MELGKGKKGTLTKSVMFYFFKNEKPKAKYQSISLKTFMLLLLRFNDFVLFPKKGIYLRGLNKQKYYIRLKVSFWVDLLPRFISSSSLQVRELFHSLLSS